MPDSPLTLNYPASLDTVVSGGEVANRAFTTLSNTITDTALSIPLTDSTVFPSTGVITLTDSLTAPTKTEDIIYTANAANTLTVPTGGRGAFGSTAQNWSGTVYVRMRMMAEHHEFNRDAVIALEAKLGYSASTPTNGKFLVGSTTAGTSTWRVLAANDIPDLSATYEPANANIQAHIASTSNPHSVTKSQVGLGSVENTALSTWTGSTNLTTLGTIGAGTWNGAVIDEDYGGAGTVSGILKANGSGTVSAAVSGTDYLSATAPGSSGNLLYNNTGVYSATTGIAYGASSGETLAVHNQTSDQYTLSARQNSTSSAAPLVNGFSAMLGLYVLNGASQYSIAYVNNAAGKIANYQLDSNDLEFDYYQIDDTYQGGNYLLSAGGLAFNSTNSDYAWIASVDDADVFGLGHGYSPSQVFDLTWGSRGITFRAPASAIADGSVATSHMHFYLDEAADALKVKWKESGGTVFNRTLANLDQTQTFTNKTLTNPVISGTLSNAATSPAQITANQNNYNPGTGWFQRWSSDASRNITGLVAGVDGQMVEIWNVGSQNIVLQNENASSTAANRFTTSTGADLTLVAGKCALGRYDATTSRWRVRLGN